MAPAGRGGAGNYEQKAQAKRATTEIDLEAQTPDSAQPTAEIAAQSQRQRDTQPYAHQGRGGAGNWYKPSDLSAKGTFSSGLLRRRAATESSTTSAFGGAFYGRGGAGNLREVDGTARGNDSRAAEEQMKEGIVKAVEVELPKPEQAYLGHRNGHSRSRSLVQPLS